MPHIHTEPNQHDATISTYIVRLDGDVPMVLLHVYKKPTVTKLVQIGGHVELDETPWQALEHELREETGYSLSQLHVLQPHTHLIGVDNSVVAPLPFIANTFKAGPEHFHDDLGYAFVTEEMPAGQPAEGESQDLRWLTMSELRTSVERDEVPRDVVDIYEAIMMIAFPNYHRIPAGQYSLEKPIRSGL